MKSSDFIEFCNAWEIKGQQREVPMNISDNAITFYKFISDVNFNGSI
jgi:hypothetical protein